MIGGVAGAHQYLARGHIDGHHRRTLGIQAVGGIFGRIGGHFLVPQEFHLGRQGFFRRFLQVDIDGNFHVVAGNGILFEIGTHNGTVGGNLVHADAVGGMEGILKGQLKAGLAHFRIHGVAIVLVLLPLLIVHVTHVTQDMGRVFGVVFPHGGGLNGQAGGVQLQHRGQVRVACVLHKFKGGQGGQAPEGQLVADAQHHAGLFIGPVFGNAVAFPEHVDQQRGGNIRVQAAAVGKEDLEIALPQGRVFLQRIGKGFGLGDGHVVHILDAVLIAELHQVVDLLVGVFGTGQHEVVDHQVVAGAVAHQHLTVAVQDLAPGRFHAGPGGKGGGVIHNAAGLNDLQVKQLEGIEAQQRGKQQSKDAGTPLGQSFHASPPIFSMARIVGYKTGSRISDIRPVSMGTPMRSRMVWPSTRATK